MRKSFNNDFERDFFHRLYTGINNLDDFMIELNFFEERDFQLFICLQVHI